MLPESGQLGLLFLAAMAGGVHCAGMCGPYVSMCSARIAPLTAAASGRNVVRVLFNLGRLGTYVALGAFAGSLGHIAGAVEHVRGVTGVVSLVAGLVTLLAALSIAGWLPGLELVGEALGVARLIREGSRRVTGGPRYVSAMTLGALQGLLPCALVYGATSRAAATASARQGALTMLVFGLGTLPALLTLTFAGGALPAWSHSRAAAAVAVAIVGALLTLRGAAGLGAIPHTFFW